MRHTEQALLELIAGARQSLLIVSFAVYNIPSIQAALVQAAARGVTLRICVESPDESQGKIAYSALTALGAQVTSRARVHLAG